MPTLTLPLNDSWGLQLNPAGDLELTDQDSSIAQDVASAIQTFLGECWYDQTLGLPYFQKILGQRPPASFVRAKLIAAAFTVVGVESVRIAALALKDRRLTGTIFVTSIYNPIPLQVIF